MPQAQKYNIQNFFYSSTAFDKSRNKSKHYHSLYEIYYLEKGECRYLIEGKIFSLTAGDIVFIPKGKIHKTTYESIHARLLINCNDEYFENFDFSEAFVYRNTEYSNEIYGILKEIEREYLNTDKFSKNIIFGLMQQMLSIIYRTLNMYTNSSHQNPYVKKALRILEKDFTTDITLSLLAEKFNISAEHFSRVFKKETGLGFSEYLSLLRLKKAESILKQNSNETVAEIAFSCGFNDSNYFCEKFKKNYGMSPLKYRKSHKQ